MGTIPAALQRAEGTTWAILASITLGANSFYYLLLTVSLKTSANASVEPAFLLNTGNPKYVAGAQHTFASGWCIKAVVDTHW